MGLQELSLHCSNWLSDDELGAAAAALPDLRRLSVMGGADNLRGLTGAGLAAFTACRRLRNIELPYSAMEDQQLLAQLPRLTSLTSVKLMDRSGRVDGSIVTALQAAFQAEHGRHLYVGRHLYSHPFEPSGS